MPLYEYRCRACGNRFEVLQPVGADGRDLQCPKCGAGRPERAVSAFACGAGGESGSASGSGFT